MKIADIYSMCGIAGILSLQPIQVSMQRVRKMTDALAHRGPDGQGHWMNSTGSIVLGHRRLAVIDISDAAAQPMHYNSRYSIVHNGEIYNYLEIKTILQQKGYVFYSASDTEVIIAAYDCWKEACLQAFDGMFAFAIWDQHTNTLFAARDRFGEKPFFYFIDKEQFLFSSEIKGIWAAGIARTVNDNALCNFISLGYVQNPSDPAETYYQSIKRLPAGHYLYYQLSDNSFSTYRYWKLEKDKLDIAISEDQAIEQYKYLWNQSLQKRLRSDVAIGTSLSGGLDSSSIVASIEKIPGLPYSLTSFSAVFPGFEKDESGFIQKLLHSYPIKNFQVSPHAEDMVRDFEKLIHQQEEPIASSSIYAQFRVFALARQQGIKVLLDGQGADEILGGYPKYYHWFWQELYIKNSFLFKREFQAARQLGITDSWNWKNKMAAWFPEKTSKFLMQNEIRNARKLSWMNPEFVQQYLHPGFNQKPVVHSLNDILYFNTAVYGLEELLRYADRNAMAHGIETRLPFLNHQLVEFLFSLPATFKFRNGYGKWLHRKAMDKILPDTITWRKDKIGYEPPQASWMGNRMMQEYIQTAKEKLVNKGVLQPSVLQKKIQPQEAYAAENNDWRWLVAGSLL